MVITLGKVTSTTPGTPVRITKDQAIPGARIPAHSMMFQALSTNGGKIYIGHSNMNKTTLAGVIAVLPTPTSSILPVFSMSIAYSPLGFNAADYWIDVDTSGDGVLVSALQA